MSDKIQIRVKNSALDCDSCTNMVERVLEKTAGVEEILIEEGSVQLMFGYDAAGIDPEMAKRLGEVWDLFQDGDG